MIRSRASLILLACVLPLVGCGEEGGPGTEDEMLNALLHINLQQMAIEADTLCSDQTSGALLNFTPFRDARGEYLTTFSQVDASGIEPDGPFITEIPGTPIDSSQDWCAVAEEINALTEQ